MAEQQSGERKGNMLPIVLALGGAAALGAVALGSRGTQATTPPAPVPPPVPGSGIPIVQTLAATAVGQSNATLNGTVDDNGGGTITDCHFDLGTDLTYGTQVPCS